MLLWPSSGPQASPRLHTPRLWLPPNPSAWFPRAAGLQTRPLLRLPPNPPLWFGAGRACTAGSKRTFFMVYFRVQTAVTVGPLRGGVSGTNGTRAPVFLWFLRFLRAKRRAFSLRVDESPSQTLWSPRIRLGTDAFVESSSRLAAGVVVEACTVGRCIKPQT